MKLNIPENFLQEETRNDYLISADMKKVWATEIEIYDFFTKLCEKHGIKYYWAYGNLLGAVRHGGFIPWDDDIDVFVTRSDYEKLCKIAKTEIPEGLFWQNDHTQWGSHIAFSKLRKDGTTAILDFEKPYKYAYHQGCFLDVFPLDNAPDDENEFKKYSKKIVLYKKLTGKWSRMFEGEKIWFERRPMYLAAVLLFIPRLIIRTFKIPNIPCRMLEKQMRKYENANTSYLGMFGLGETKRYPKSCFSETVMLPFEFFSVPCPSGYNELLDIDYGDWKVFKRGAEGGCMHLGMLYDTEKDYRKYL